MTMKIITAPTVPQLHGALVMDICHAIVLALATGMKTIIATPAGFFVTGGKS